MNGRVELGGPAHCELVSLQHGEQSGWRWHLDTPNRNDPCQRLAPCHVRVRGWIAPDDGRLETRRLPMVAVRETGLTRSYRLNEWRGDVIKKVLGLTPSEHTDWTCGFDLAIQEFGQIEVGFDLEGSLTWVWQVRLLAAAPDEASAHGRAPA